MLLKTSKFGLCVPYFALSGNYVSFCQPRWRERRWWKWWWNGTREEWKGHGPGWKNDSYSDGTLQGMAIPILYKFNKHMHGLLEMLHRNKIVNFAVVVHYFMSKLDHLPQRNWRCQVFRQYPVLRHFIFTVGKGYNTSGCMQTSQKHALPHFIYALSCPLSFWHR